VRRNLLIGNKWKVVCVFVLLLPFVLSPLIAQYLVPPYSIIYEDLRYLRLRSGRTDLDFLSGPFLCTDIINFCSSFSFDKQKKITSSFCFRSGGSGEKQAIIAGVNSDLHLVRERKVSRVNPFFRTFSFFSPASGVGIVNVMAVDPRAPDFEGYIGKEWRGLAGYTEQAYLLIERKFMRITLGRSYYTKGSGRTGNLTFSRFCRPMDSFQFHFRRKFFTMSFILAQLDPINGKRRYLSSHTFGFRYRNLSIDFTEAFLYGGSDRIFSFSLLNPFLFFHGEQMNDNSLGLTGNTLGSIAFDYLFSKWAVYGEVLIDDVQLDKKEPGDLEPNEVGVLLGFESADILGLDRLYLGIEYVALTNRTYKTPNEHEWYLHRNVPIGYPLGSDLDRFNVFIKRYLGKNIRLGFQYNLIRQGEGELDKPWDSPWMKYTIEEGYSEPFPTGVVEYTNKIEFMLYYLFSYDNYLYFSAGYTRISNYEHNPGVLKNEFFCKVGWWLDFKKAFYF